MNPIIYQKLKHNIYITQKLENNTHFMAKTAVNVYGVLS